MKIIIKVPEIGKKWRVSFGGTPSSRKNATLIFKLVERRLFLGVGIKEKTSILVKYGKDVSNETLVSLDARYLLYTLVCFLEDYLTKEYLAEKYKQYSQK